MCQEESSKRGDSCARKREVREEIVVPGRKREVRMQMVVPGREK